MKITVTGATGFVGRHVLNVLAGRGSCEVTATGRGAMVPTDLPTGVRYVALDVAAAGTDDLFDLLNRPDVLVHLAWNGLPNYRSLHHFETELPAHYAFLKAIVGQGLRHLVVSGTCYEYGMVSGQLVESMAPQPANPYAYAKDALRRQLEFLRQTETFELTWARLFYMYGRGQAPSSLYSQLQKAVTERALSFPMSLGDQLRDFLPVEQVAAQLVELATRGQGVGIVNVCSGTPVSIRSLVERWLSESGSTIHLDRGRYPYPDFEPLAFWGSSERRLGFTRDHVEQA